MTEITKSTISTAEQEVRGKTKTKTKTKPQEKNPTQNKTKPHHHHQKKPQNPNQSLETTLLTDNITSKGVLLICCSTNRLLKCHCLTFYNLFLKYMALMFNMEVLSFSPGTERLQNVGQEAFKPTVLKSQGEVSDNIWHISLHF